VKIGRRRLSFLLVTSAIVPAVAFAQTKQLPARIALVINAMRGSDSNARVEAFAQGMSELGYVEGRDYVLDLRHAEGRLDHLPMLISDALRARPDVLVISGSQAAWAAKKATSTVPVVLATVADPVGQGLITSLARPGGNLTGFAILSDVVLVKSVELARELLPQASSLGYLVNPETPIFPILWKHFETAAVRLGFKPLRFEATNAEELDRALAYVVRERPGGLVVAQNALFVTGRKKIAEFALRNKIVALHPTSDAVVAGGLISYAADLTDPFRKSAAVVHRILKGAKPAELPVEQATRLELYVNLKTAQALGLTIPKSVLLRADRVIQ
jgi:putative ABC transport system substrate-binding protein